MSLKRYRKSLQRLKPKVVVLKTKVNEAGNALIVNYKITPPFNTFAIFENYTDASDLMVGDADGTTELPTNFSWWREYYDFFPSSLESDKTAASVINNISSKISSAPNQGACGSCWAVSVASCISDNILVKQFRGGKAVNECVNPRLSSTYLLSCNEQFECAGGSTLDALRYIESNGIATVNCIDYSWLQTAPNCPMDELSRTLTFDTNVFTMNENTLENTITNVLDAAAEKCVATIPDCGCYKNPQKHQLFTITNPQAVQCKGDRGDRGVEAIKRRILQKGPVIGNFAVRSNFEGAFGNFKESDNIYIDIAKYPSITQTESNSTIPGHAVVIVGWGQKDNVSFKYNSGGEDIDVEAKEPITYWIARNSWGVPWGSINDRVSKGYFLMAMRQQVSNKLDNSGSSKPIQIGDLSCLEYPVEVLIDNQKARMGGIVTFDVPDLYVLPTTPQDEVDPTGKLKQDDTFYEADVESSIFSDLYKKALDAEYIRAKNTRFVVMLIIVMLFATLLYFY